MGIDDKQCRKGFFFPTVVAAWCVLQLVVIASPALALFPGDCGKPTSTGTLAVSTNPTASDGLAALRAAVGSEFCHVDICDVNDSGAVKASDALAILRKAVGVAITLNCPVTDVNCSDTELRALMDMDDAPGGFTKASVDVAGLVHCATSFGGGVLASEWTAARREFSTNSLWLHGKDVTLSRNPSCTPANTDGQEFLTLAGDDSGVSGFSVVGFCKGIIFEGENGTAGNMDLSFQGDSSIVNAPTAVGSIVRESSISNGYFGNCTKDEGDNSLLASGCGVMTGSCV